MGSFKQWLAEMPISISNVGNQKYRWGTPESDKFFNSPKAIDKVKRIYDKSIYDFNLYLINQEGLERPAEGERHPISDADNVYKMLNISPEEAPLKPEAINVFFTHWQGSKPPSAWMIAHRFAHCVINYGTPIQKQIIELLNKHFEYEIEFERKSHQQIMAKILTMKSARSGFLSNNGENFVETCRELLTQFVINRKVSFRNLNPIISEKLTKDFNDYFATVMNDSKNYIHIL